MRPSAYEALKDYNFPIGILPKGVLDYNLDPSDGKFCAYLNGTCDYNLDPSDGKFCAYLNGTCGFSLEGSYRLKHKSTIKGNISKGWLSSLEGVSVKLFFMWVDIVEGFRSDDHLEFSDGIAGSDFPVDNFVECPQCGCGLNCGDGGPSKQG